MSEPAGELAREQGLCCVSTYTLTYSGLFFGVGNLQLRQSASVLFEPRRRPSSLSSSFSGSSIQRPHHLLSLRPLTGLLAISRTAGMSCRYSHPLHWTSNRRRTQLWYRGGLGTNLPPT